jgi:energy-converting hydrogenase A subunit M
MEQSLKLYGLMCPQCGGNLSFKEGAKIVNCEYCDSSLFLVFEEGIIAYYLPAVVTRKGAVDKVRSLFDDEEAAIELRTEAVLSDISLYYVPYWRFKTAIFGFVEGIETVDRRYLLPDNAEESAFIQEYVKRAFEPVVKRAKRKQVKNIIIINISASNMSDVGVPNLNSYRQMCSEMEIHKRMDQFPNVGLMQKSKIKNAVIIDRMYSQKMAEEEADKIITQFMETRGSGLHEYTASLQELRRRAFLIYYPVWLCKFKFRRRFYRVVIDGLNNKIISAIIPRQQKGRVLGIIGIALLLAIIISTILRALFFGGEIAKFIFRNPISWVFLTIILIGLGTVAGHVLRVFYEDKDITIEG